MAQLEVDAGALWQRFAARFSKRDLLEGAITP